MVGLKSIIIICFYVLMSPAMCQFNNTPVLPDFPSFELEVLDDSFSGYYMMNLAMNSPVKDRYIVMMDDEANVVLVEKPYSAQHSHRF